MLARSCRRGGAEVAWRSTTRPRGGGQRVGVDLLESPDDVSVCDDITARSLSRRGTFESAVSPLIKFS